VATSTQIKAGTITTSRISAPAAVWRDMGESVPPRVGDWGDPEESVPSKAPHLDWEDDTAYGQGRESMTTAEVIRVGDWVSVMWNGGLISEGKVKWWQYTEDNQTVIGWRDEYCKQDNCSVVPPLGGMVLRVLPQDDPGSPYLIKGKDPAVLPAPDLEELREKLVPKQPPLADPPPPPDLAAEREIREARRLKEMIRSFGEAGFRSQYYIGPSYMIKDKAVKAGYLAWERERNEWVATGDVAHKEAMVAHVSYDCPPEPSNVLSDPEVRALGAPEPAVAVLAQSQPFTTFGWWVATALGLGFVAAVLMQLLLGMGFL
jgi:hypothetical protein